MIKFVILSMTTKDIQAIRFDLTLNLKVQAFLNHESLPLI